MPSRLAFPRVCIALGFPDPAALLAHARHEAQAGESFLEIRLDYLAQPAQGLDVIRDLLQEHPDCTVLATCRRKQNHGRFTGSIDEQLRLLQAALHAGARAVDIEIETAENSPRRESFPKGGALILSYHNFESTPAMESVLRRMLRQPADAYKIVTTARKPTDMLRVLALGKAHARAPLILLSMGDIGIPSRVVAAAHGSLYTYAAPATAEGTAPGQLNARLLRSLYRLDKISRTTKVYGVVADPVRHSLSPQIHNRAFQSKRLDAVYLPFLVPPPQLRDLFQFAAALPLAGMSVTIPHKQRVVRYLDIVEPLARRIGAVNTVWRKSGKWRGTNTDAAGVTIPLGKVVRLARASVLLVGTGGAARGAAFALTDAGARVTVTGRNMEKADALAKACGATALSLSEAVQSHFDALVQATPVGMHPHEKETIFPDRIPAQIVFDMVYNPLETRLIRDAKNAGLTVIPGLQMFLEQAAQQFEIWTGENAPRAVMERAALEALVPGYTQSARIA